MFPDFLLKVRLWNSPYLCIHNFSVPEEHDCGNAPDHELRRNHGVLINIEFPEGNFSCII